MGKSGNAGGGKGEGTGQAKAKAKAGANEKEKAGGAGPKEGAKASKGKDAEASKADSKVDEAKAKLLEEAQQKFVDDERDEKSRGELREQNRKIDATGPVMTGNRDKSIARVTKLQNKLKLFKGEIEYAAVEKDIDGVDASKYVSELAECVMEAAGTCLKLKEMTAGVKVCTRLRATYDEFSVHLARALKKAFDATAAADMNRRRFLLRFCIELVLVECIPASKSPLLAIIKELTDGSAAEDVILINFTILASVAQKYAVAVFNVEPNKQKAFEEVLGKPWCERTCVVEDGLRSQLHNLVVNMYLSCAPGLLQTAHSRLLEQEKTNAKIRVDKGAVDAENQTKHEGLKEAFTKLHTNLSTLSEHLNQPLVSAQEEDVSRIGVVETKKQEVVEEELPMIWEDAEQQKFYEAVMDPKDVIPAVLLQSGKKEVEKAEAPAEGEEGGEKTMEPKKSEEEEKKDLEEMKKERQEARAQMATDFELYLARVSKAESAKQVDDCVIEFFHEYNSKGNRRLLAMHFFQVPRTRLHLLAPHARFIATIAAYVKDIPTSVMNGLQKELNYMMKEKDPVHIESKIKTVRYLCELCKFKVCPPGVILDMFKDFCDDFSHHHAELCANILQSCGRFLCYTPETATRTDNLLERMARLKNAKSTPLRLEIMLEDAYYQVKPPESKKKSMKEKDPLELFVLHIVCDRLYKDEDEARLLKLVRKLPTENSPALGWLKKYILDLNMHASYENLYLVASLLSGLAKYRDYFVIDVVDTLFEDIQATLERNDFREMPLRVRQVKLLGELYNYRLVDNGLVFDALYQFIGFSGPTAYRAGHATTAHRILEKAAAARKGSLSAISEEALGETPEGVTQLPAILADPQHPLEAPWDYFRIKLVCVLLDVCAHYFHTGSAKSKLDRFLHFFMRYVHSKGELPLRFMNMVYDTMERLRPKMKFPETKAEADAVILKILKDERETLDLDAEKNDEENGIEKDDEDEDVSESDDGSGSDEDEESEEEESSEEEEEEDEEYSRRGPGPNDEKTQHEKELDDFDREMRQLLADSMERERKLPMPTQKMVELPERPAVGDSPPAAPGAFSLLQKRTGGKVQMKQLHMPSDSLLAVAQQSRSEQVSEEKEDLKRFIMHAASSGPSSSASGLKMRAGKGGGKGGVLTAREARERRKAYLKDEFIPEDDEPEQLMPGQTIRLSGWSGSGGSGSRSAGGQGGGGGGHAASGKGKGSSKGKAAGRGTPSNASRSPI